MPLIDLSDYDMADDFSATPEEMEEAITQVRKDFVTKNASYSFTAACLYHIWQRTVSRWADQDTYLWFRGEVYAFNAKIDKHNATAVAGDTGRKIRSGRERNGSITFATFVRVALDLEFEADTALAERFSNALDWIDDVFGGEDDLDPEDIAYNIDFMGGFDLTSDGTFSNQPTPANWAARRLALEQMVPTNG